MSLTLDEVIELFDKNNDEHGKFELIKNKFSKKHDLHGFILLDKLLPDVNNDIIGDSGHEEFYIGVDMDEFSKVATEEIIIELLRCSINYDSSNDCLFRMI